MKGKYEVFKLFTKFHSLVESLLQNSKLKCFKVMGDEDFDNSPMISFFNKHGIYFQSIDILLR